MLHKYCFIVLTMIAVLLAIIRMNNCCRVKITLLSNVNVVIFESN